MKRSAEELYLYTRKKLRRGYPAGELKNELLDEGYSAEEIDSAFYNSAAPSGHASKINPGQYPLWFFLAVGLLILGISFKSIQRKLFGGDWTDIVLIVGILGTTAGLIFIYTKNQKDKTPS